MQSSRLDHDQMTRRDEAPVRLREILQALPGKRVLIVGDVMLDEYIWGEVRRISPEAPVPVVEIQRRTFVPGGAANTAANVAALQGNPVLVSVVGRDNYADQLRRALEENGVRHAELVGDETRPTTTKTRIVAHSQQVARLDAESRAPLSPATEQRLLEVIEREMPRVDACTLSDYAKGVISHGVAQRFIELARQQGKPIIVDPKGADYAKYRGATLVKPNVHEAERASNHEIHSEPDLIEAGRLLRDILQGSSLLITRGAQGMTLFENGDVPVHVAARASNVFDVTGAGDTVTSALSLALASGVALRQAAAIANCAAALAVAKVGTATVTLEELSAACE
jgi:rfaE bifunctional protein kinase chain/domain